MLEAFHWKGTQSGNNKINQCNKQSDFDRCFRKKFDGFKKIKHLQMRTGLLLKNNNKKRKSYAMDGGIVVHSRTGLHITYGL